MLVKIRVTGNVWGVLGIFWPIGHKEWIDEKQAQIGVEAKVMEIIERPERIAIPAFKKKLNVR